MTTLWVEAAPWAHLIMMFSDKAINTPGPTGEALIAAGFLGRYLLCSLLPAWAGGLFVTVRALQASPPGSVKPARFHNHRQIKHQSEKH